MTESWEPQVPPLAPRPAARGFPVGLTIATVIAFANLVGLGVWQLQRLKWKEALLAHVATAQAAAPRPLEAVLDAQAAGRDQDFVRVKVACPGLAHAPALELYALREGHVGARLVSACPVATSAFRSILVDRGFVPDTVAARPRVDPADAQPVELVGVLRRPERGNFMTPAHTAQHWFLHDPKAMGPALRAPAPVAPLVLMAETPTNRDFPALRPAPFPVDIPNRHLEYALTWFGLAGALVGVYGAAVFKRMQG